MRKQEKENHETRSEYLYDAFISYRHAPLDKAVAKRLQELLENFRFQKKKTERLRIFRDQSELSTSNDLGSEIREALLRSKYLIVVCSEKTKDSHWCAEEIRLFKEAHQGSTSRILTLIVSGEPEKVLPEELCWEKRSSSTPVGSAFSHKEKIEPLSADVRAQSYRKSLRKLKVEFLRIAAPMLECGFDELFQRRQRRRRRNAVIIFAGTMTLLVSVLLVVSFFAYQTAVSRNNYRDILVDNYTKEGNRYANLGKPQEALLYYMEALSLNSEKTPAASGAALLLQDYLWPVPADDSKEDMPGCIKNRTLLPFAGVAAGDPEKGFYLYITLEQGMVLDDNSFPIEELGADYRNFLGASAGWWSFAGENGFHFYCPETGVKRDLPYSDEISAGCSMDDTFFFNGVSALAYSEDKVIVAQNGIVQTYVFDAQGIAVMTAQADLAEAFPVDGAKNGISRQNPIFLSEDGSLALISSYDHVAFYNTENLSLKATVPRYLDGLTDVDISSGNEYVVLTYGNPYRISGINPGGYFEVYSGEGEPLFSSPKNDKDALLGTAFDPIDPTRLLVWGSDFVQVWNWKEEREIMAPVRKSDINAACFTDEGTLLVGSKKQTVTAYTLTEFVPNTEAKGQGGDELPFIRQYYMDAEGPDGMVLSVSSSALTLTDENGKVLDRIEIPATGQRVALSEDFCTAYLYNNNSPALMCVPVDFEAGKLGNPSLFDTGDEAVLGIWFGEGWIAVETSSRNLLLFDDSGTQICKILPEHNGNVVSVLVDSNFRHIICVMERVTGDSDDFHFDTNGIVEIWDISSRLLLSSYEREGRKMDTASIMNDDTLFWSVNGEKNIRRISMPVPDEDAVGFMRELSCFTLDENQNLVMKRISASNLTMGNWSVFTGEKEKKEKLESEPDLTELVGKLYTADNCGSDEWFEQCDALWQRLAKKELSYTLSDLDTLYLVYCNPVIYTDATDRIAFGLKTYIALTQNLVQESIDSGEDEPLFSNFHENLMKTLSATQEYDGIIIQAFRDTAEINTLSMEKSSQENAAMTIYSAKYLEAWAECINGNGVKSMSDLAEYCAANSELLYLGEVEPVALADLYAGSPRSAADFVNRWMSDCMLMFSEEDTSFLEELLAGYLQDSELLVWREEIDASVFDEYLRMLNADFGIEVAETSPESQHAGIMPGDLIISVDGRRVAGIQHYIRLRNEEKTQDFEILRDGKIITLTLSGPVNFAGEMKVRL